MTWNLYDYSDRADNPQWERAGRVHDWRNHVPDKIIGLWPQLSPDARCVAVFMAEQMAHAEEWD